MFLINRMVGKTFHPLSLTYFFVVVDSHILFIFQLSVFYAIEVNAVKVDFNYLWLLYARII